MNGLLAQALLGLHRGCTPMQSVQPSVGCPVLVDLEGLQLLESLRERCLRAQA